MKLRKFLKLIKSNCKDRTCGSKDCPVAILTDCGNGNFRHMCFFGDANVPEDWDIELLIKNVKKWRNDRERNK